MIKEYANLPDQLAGTIVAKIASRQTEAGVVSAGFYFIPDEESLKAEYFIRDDDSAECRVNDLLVALHLANCCIKDLAINGILTQGCVTDTATFTFPGREPITFSLSLANTSLT